MTNTVRCWEFFTSQELIGVRTLMIWRHSESSDEANFARFVDMRNDKKTPRELVDDVAKIPDEITRQLPYWARVLRDICREVTQEPSHVASHGDPAGTFDSKELGKVVIEVLDVKTGDEIEVLRDRLNPLRIMIVRHPQPQKE